MTQNTETLSSPPAIIYTTRHSIDTACGVSFELAARLGVHDGPSAKHAFLQVIESINDYRFHTDVLEMEAYWDSYDPDIFMDFDVGDRRYNAPIDGVEYPSATAETLCRNGWAESTGPNTISITMDRFDSGVQKAVARFVSCVNDNNGKNSQKGGYLKSKVFSKYSFADCAKLVTCVKDGNSQADRDDLYHKMLAVTTCVGHLLALSGITFPEQNAKGAPLRKEGGLLPVLEGFGEAFPDIKEELQIGAGKLTRTEIVYYLEGFLVGLFALGYSHMVQSYYDFWKEVFVLAEKVIEDREETARILMGSLVPSENIFKLHGVPRGVGLYFDIDDNIGKQIWDFTKRPGTANKWSLLQIEFHRMLTSCMDDEIDGIVLDDDVRNAKATELTNDIEKRSRVVIDFIKAHVSNAEYCASLLCLQVVYNLSPALLIMRSADEHCVALTNGHLEIDLELQDVDAHFELLEPGVWHLETRFASPMLMTRSGKINDKEASELSSESIREIFARKTRSTPKKMKKTSVHRESKKKKGGLSLSSSA